MFRKWHQKFQGDLYLHRKHPFGMSVLVPIVNLIIREAIPRDQWIFEMVDVDATLGEMLHGLWMIAVTLTAGLSGLELGLMEGSSDAYDAFLSTIGIRK